MDFYKLETVFKDGEYQGLSILDVFKYDPSYIHLRIKKDSNFCLNPEVINHINNETFEFKIKQCLIDILNQRLEANNMNYLYEFDNWGEVIAMSNEDDYEDDEDDEGDELNSQIGFEMKLELDDYLSNFDHDICNDRSEDLNRNPYYNHDLDNDQQSLEFWNSIS